MGLGYQELIIIFLIVLVLFGGKKIPEIARGMGKGIREFKKAKDDLHNAIEEEVVAQDSKKKPRKKLKTASSEDKTEEKSDA